MSFEKLAQQKIMQEITQDSVAKMIELNTQALIGKTNNSKLRDLLQAQISQSLNGITDEEIENMIDLDHVVAYEDRYVRVLNHLDCSKMYGTKELVILLPRYVTTRPNSLKQLRKYVESKIEIDWSRVTFMSVVWNKESRKSFTINLVKYLSGAVNLLYWIDPEVINPRFEVQLESWFRPYPVQAGSDQNNDPNRIVEINIDFSQGEYFQQAGRMKRDHENSAD